MATPFPFSPATRRLIELAITEDLYAGDVTSDAIFPPDHRTTAWVVAKSESVLAGLAVFEEVFRQVDPTLDVEWTHRDGQRVGRGTVGRIDGATRSILRAERTALNFLRHLCGVATLTDTCVRALDDARTRIVDTRKTTPGFRELEKYAVRMGGGANHRYNLSSGAMLKDNHIAAAGSIVEAVRRVRAHAPFLVRVEVEATCHDEIVEALAAGADAILLDNMTTDAMRQAVAFIAGRALVEASGNITLARLPELRGIGLDVISIGALTHSAPNADLSLHVGEPPTAAPVVATPGAG